MDAFGWEYDPNNPLGKEEQKKAWQDSGQKSGMLKKGANAFALEKKVLTTEEKKAKWKAGVNPAGIAAKALG